MSDEKGSVFSLRKKRSVRPKISAPRQIGSPAPIAEPLPSLAASKLQAVQSDDNLAKPISSSPSRRPSPARENTADYVKRRYSTRFLNQGPIAAGSAPPVPSLPNLHPATSQPSSLRPVKSSNANGRLAVDHRALGDPGLQPEPYVANLLADATEQDIREYQQELSNVKSHAAVDLQNTVYQNRDQFIKISQEAEKLKGEMRALRNLMSDLTGTLGQTNAALGINLDTVTARKFANRSSVANLEAMWSSHLQELWRRVEGSQRFLPAIPGRHVVHESGRWLELNTATWKPRQRVHLILLNDHLLVAVEKKRVEQTPQNHENPRSKPAANQIQLVAERISPLQDVEMADLKDMAAPNASSGRSNRTNTANAINVQIANESFTFAATDGSGHEKLALLSKFRKSLADLRKVLQLEVDERPFNRHGGRPASAGRNESSRSVNGMAEVAPTARQSTMLVDVDGRQQTYRWVETQVDELDIDIALQRFDEAVDRVVKLRRIAERNKTNLAIQDLSDGKVHDRAGRLARILTRQLCETSAWMTSTQQHVAWLTKLGFEAHASEAFLEARTEAIKKRTGQCADQGDLQQYLYQLSFIHFTIIRNTFSLYQACFPTVMGSSCVKWAKEHVDAFNVVFARQTAKMAHDDVVRRSCLERAKEHAAMLRRGWNRLWQSGGRGCIACRPTPRSTWP